MLTQQNTQSIAVIKVNFMDPTKKADKIAEKKSKAFNTVYRDKSIGVIAEIHDGLNLMVKFSDAGSEDVTAHIKGADVNVRFNKEQWNTLNSRFHSMDAIGAYVEVVVDGDVEYGDLTVNGEDVQSFTIYADSIAAIEPMELARVGSVTTKDDFFAKVTRDKTRKSSRTDEARAMSRAARLGTEATGRKKAKV